MSSPFQPITQADFDALATLANAKLSPISPYAFPPFAGTDDLALVASISATPTYGIGSFSDGQKVTLWLFSYKIIAGTKTYSWMPFVKVFTGASGSGDFSLTWNWTTPTGPTAPDGYVAVIPQSQFDYLWKDIGSVITLTEDGSFTGWLDDASLRDSGANNTPCSNGIWLKLLNRIHQRACLMTDIECLNSGDVTGLQNNATGEIGNGSVTPLGIEGLLSGPWCVAVSGRAGVNTLVSWITRAYMYVQGATAGFTPGYTQTYRNIKFYFRAVDGPDVNITAQNQLLTYRIGSDLMVTTTAHYHLGIVSCSDGHIKIQDAGGGTVRADMDVTAGSTYDFSFDITGLVASGLSIPKDLDFTFTTAAATGPGVAAIGIELNNDVRSIDVPDSYCEIEFNNPVQNGVGGYTTIQLCTTCTQLTLTENNNVPGIWVANTIPTLGIMPYLDQDLPQYSPQSVPLPASSRRIPLSDSLPNIASVDNRGALYPIYRDTDFIPDSVAGMPLRGSEAWQKAIATKSIRSVTFGDSVDPSGIDQTLFIESTGFIAAGTPNLRFYTDNPATTLYVKAGAFPTVADFDVSAPGGTWIDLETALPGFPTDTTYYYGMLNPEAAPITVNNTYLVFNDDTPPNGTFFPTDDLGRPQIEGFSYKFSNPDYVGQYPIPQFGYCVYQVTVRRQPVENGKGIKLAPAAGTADLTVKLGIKAGFGFDSAGTFTQLAEVIIPAGQAEIQTDVFWPVLSGTPLAYRCSEIVVARAQVNFQPQMHCQFSVTSSPYGFWSGQPWFNKDYTLISVTSTQTIELPIAAVILNDLTDTLNLLP